MLQFVLAHNKFYKKNLIHEVKKKNVVGKLNQGAFQLVELESTGIHDVDSLYLPFELVNDCCYSQQVDSVRVVSISQV